MRGVKLHSNTDSLRETLAAAVIQKSLLESTLPALRMWDPFCGSGTLLLEAFSEMKGIPPLAYKMRDSNRHKFHMEDWRVHDKLEFERFVEGSTIEWQELLKNGGKNEDPAEASLVDSDGELWVLDKDDVSDQLDDESDNSHLADLESVGLPPLGRGVSVPFYSFIQRIRCH